MSLSIRAMIADDLLPMLALTSESLEAPRWTRRDYEQIVFAVPADPLVRCGLVALSGDRLVGLAVASCLRQETAAEIEGLFVAEAHRRQGIGDTLVRACMHWAVGIGAAMVRLEVRASNTAALALYQRLGFSAMGVRRAYYSAPPEDALLLEARIPL